MHHGLMQVNKYIWEFFLNYLLFYLFGTVKLTLLLNCFYELLIN